MKLNVPIEILKAFEELLKDLDTILNEEGRQFGLVAPNGKGTKLDRSGRTLYSDEEIEKEKLPKDLKLDIRHYDKRYFKICYNILQRCYESILCIKDDSITFGLLPQLAKMTWQATYLLGDLKTFKDQIQLSRETEKSPPSDTNIKDDLRLQALKNDVSSKLVNEGLLGDQANYFLTGYGPIITRLVFAINKCAKTLEKIKEPTKFLDTYKIDFDVINRLVDFSMTVMGMAGKIGNQDKEKVSKAMKEVQEILKMPVSQIITKYVVDPSDDPVKKVKDEIEEKKKKARGKERIRDRVDMQGDALELAVAELLTAVNQWRARIHPVVKAAPVLDPERQSELESLVIKDLDQFFKQVFLSAIEDLSSKNQQKNIKEEQREKDLTKKDKLEEFADEQLDSLKLDTLDIEYKERKRKEVLKKLEACKGSMSDFAEWKKGRTLNKEYGDLNRKKWRLAYYLERNHQVDIRKEVEFIEGKSDKGIDDLRSIIEALSKTDKKEKDKVAELEYKKVKLAKRLDKEKLIKYEKKIFYKVDKDSIEIKELKEVEKKLLELGKNSAAYFQKHSAYDEIMKIAFEVGNYEVLFEMFDVNSVSELIELVFESEESKETVEENKSQRLLSILTELSKKKNRSKANSTLSDFSNENGLFEVFEQYDKAKQKVLDEMIELKKLKETFPTRETKIDDQLDIHVGIVKVASYLAQLPMGKAMQDGIFKYSTTFTQNVSSYSLELIKSAAFLVKKSCHKKFILPFENAKKTLVAEIVTIQERTAESIVNLVNGTDSEPSMLEITQLETTINKNHKALEAIVKLLRQLEMAKDQKAFETFVLPEYLYDENGKKYKLKAELRKDYKLLAKDCENLKQNLLSREKGLKSQIERAKVQKAAIEFANSTVKKLQNYKSEAESLTDPELLSELLSKLSVDLNRISSRQTPHGCIGKPTDELREKIKKSFQLFHDELHKRRLKLIMDSIDTQTFRERIQKKGQEKETAKARSNAVKILKLKKDVEDSARDIQDNSVKIEQLEKEAGVFEEIIRKSQIESTAANKEIETHESLLLDCTNYFKKFHITINRNDLLQLYPEINPENNKVRQFICMIFPETLFTGYRQENAKNMINASKKKLEEKINTSEELSRPLLEKTKKREEIARKEIERLTQDSEAKRNIIKNLETQLSKTENNKSEEIELSQEDQLKPLEELLKEAEETVENCQREIISMTSELAQKVMTSYKKSTKSSQQSLESSKITYKIMKADKKYSQPMVDNNQNLADTSTILNHFTQLISNIKSQVMNWHQYRDNAQKHLENAREEFHTASEIYTNNSDLIYENQHQAIESGIQKQLQTIENKQKELYQGKAEELAQIKEYLEKLIMLPETFSYDNTEQDIENKIGGYLLSLNRYFRLQEPIQVVNSRAQEVLDQNNLDSQVKGELAAIIKTCEQLNDTFKRVEQRANDLAQGHTDYSQTLKKLDQYIEKRNQRYAYKDFLFSGNRYARVALVEQIKREHRDYILTGNSDSLLNTIDSALKDNTFAPGLFSGRDPRDTFRGVLTSIKDEIKQRESNYHHDKDSRSIQKFL